jgi:hypothetical protein
MKRILVFAAWAVLFQASLLAQAPVMRIGSSAE